MGAATVASRASGAARILRIELRRSLAPWAAFLIAATGAFVLFASNPPSRVDELLATTARPRRWRVLPVAAAMGIAAVAAYLLMFAAGIGHLRHPEGHFPTGAVPLIAVGALALVAAVWLGLAIGTLLPSPLTAPILVVVGFLGMALLPFALAPNSRPRPGTFLLLPYLQGPRDDPFLAQVLTVRANLAQALWPAAVAGTGLALCAAARPGTRVGGAAAGRARRRGRGTGDATPTRSGLGRRPASHRIDLYPRRADHLRLAAARHRIAGPARARPPALAVLNAKLPPAPTRIVVDSVKGDLLQGAQPADTLLVSPPSTSTARCRRPPTCCG